MRIRIGLVVLGIVLSACGDDATPQPSAVLSPSGTAPVSTASLAPLGGELALRLVQIGDVSWIYPVAQATIMSDGRVVTPPSGPDHDWRQRRLSAAGVSAIGELAERTGLFTASAEYPMLHRPGAPEWPGMGGSLITITRGDGAGQVVVSGGVWFGDEFEATYNVSSPERKALTELAAKLSDLSWLPDGAWLDPEPRPYQPAGFLLITSWSVAGGSGPSVEDVDWPFEEPLAEFGEEMRQSVVEMLRCGTVDADAAQAIVDELNRLTQADGVPTPIEFSAALRSGEAAVELHLEPMLPDGFPGCDDLLVGGA
ncbi:MAG TPA: hypothetical protein VF013_06570 [Candidatus Limnocylindria bacterium]